MWCHCFGRDGTAPTSSSTSPLGVGLWTLRYGYKCAHLDDGTDCYFTCWTCIPGTGLGVIIHHPPFHLLLKGVCVGISTPTRRFLPLQKFVKIPVATVHSLSWRVLCTLFQLLYLAVFQDCYGTPIKARNLIILCSDPFHVCKACIMYAN